MKLSHLRLPFLCLGFLLPGLTQCTTPGTVSTRTGNVASTGSSFASGLGSFAEAILDIPMTILSIPADILGDPGTMGAIAQAASSYNDTYSSSSSYGSGSSYSGYSGSSYSNDSSSSYGSSSSYRANDSSEGELYTGVSKRMLGTGADEPDEESSGSARDGVRDFEKAQMDKVEAYKRWINGGGSGATVTTVSTQSGKPEPTRHTKRVPATNAGEWAHVGDFDGIRVWWKYRRELKDQYESALKMENMNSYRVTISYKPWFIAEDGTDYTESGGRFSMRPGQVSTGNSAGLFYYVEGADGRTTAGPQAGGVKDMMVMREDR